MHQQHDATVPSSSDEESVSLRADVGGVRSSVAKRPVRTTRVDERRTKSTSHQLGHVDEYHRHQQTQQERTCRVTRSLLYHSVNAVVP